MTGDEDLLALREKLLATLTGAAKAEDDEDEARAKVRTDLLDSAFAANFGAAFEPLNRGAMTMWDAYRRSLAMTAALYVQHGVDLKATADLVKATAFIAAATVFALVEDPLEEEVAAILGMSWEDEKWPGPRYVPSWVR